MAYRFTRFVTALLFSLSLAFSSGASQPVSSLIQGRLINTADGKGVGAKISFVSLSGKIINCKSNSSDGSFQQSVDGGETFSIVVAGYILTERDLSFSTPKNSYAEITKDINVTKIEEGMALFSARLFKPNDASLIQPLPDDFASLEKFLDVNLPVEIMITVSSADSYFKEQKVNRQYVDAKGKTKTKKITLSVEDQAKELVQKRIEILSAYIANLKKASKRISVDSKVVANDIKKAPKKPKSKKGTVETDATPAINNIIVTVSKIKNL